MALINCSECEAQISDKSTNCVKCGAPVVKKETFKCFECGTELEKGTKVCGNCGAEQENKSEIKEEKSLEKKISTPLPQLQKKKGSIIKKIFISLGIILILLIGMIIIGNLVRANQEKENKRYAKNHINELVELSHSDYQYREIGGISGLNVTIKNNSEYFIDRVRVRVAYIKSNGDIHKTEILDFDGLFRDGDEITLHAPDSDRGTSISCEIEYINSVDLDLY